MASLREWSQLPEQLPEQLIREWSQWQASPQGIRFEEEVPQYAGDGLVIEPGLQHHVRHGRVPPDQVFFTAIWDLLPVRHAARRQHGDGRLHLPLCILIGAKYGVYIVRCEDDDLAERLLQIQDRLRKQRWWPKNPAQIAARAAMAAAARGGPAPVPMGGAADAADVADAVAATTIKLPLNTRLVSCMWILCKCSSIMPSEMRNILVS
jgi:hypothetical protein